MSFRLPSVIVYQQLISTTVSPTTPFMDLCVVGPVYQCQNGTDLAGYTVQLPDKIKTQAEVEKYETKTTKPAIGDPYYIKFFPEIKTGAILDEDSVYLTLSNINVKVWPTTTATSSNVILDNTGASSIIKSSTATGAEALSSAKIQVGDEVDFLYQDGTDPDTGEAIDKVVTAKIYEIVYVKDDAGEDTTTIDYYRLQKNVLTTLYPEAHYIKATVKRALDDTRDLYPDYPDSYYEEEGNEDKEKKTATDPVGFTITYTKKTNDPMINLTIGGVKVPVDDEALTTTVVIDCSVAVSYRALRTDVANDFITISSYSDALAYIGSPDISNPMSVAAQIINTAVGSLTYRVLPIATNDFSGYSQALDILSNDEKVYVIEPLMAGLTDSVKTQVVQAYNSHCKAMSEAEKSRWRIMYANLPMPATKVMVELNEGTLMTMGSETEYMLKEAFTAEDTGWTEDSGAYKRTITKTSKFLSLYNSDTSERLPQTGGTWGSYTVSEDGLTVTITANTKFNGYANFVDKSFDYTTATCYLKDLDTNVGGFVSNTCRPTDYVDFYLKTKVSGVYKYTYKYSLMIKSIITDSACICYTQKWIRKGDGYYIAEGEYQHFAPELANQGTLPDYTNAPYEVVRVLDTAGMAEVLSSVAQSYKTKRLRYVQPDKVMVTVNAVDYLLDGQYLCIALAAMRAGLPPHQGFSTMGISGIKRITRSNKMFTEDQLSEMASNGVFWVAQDNNEALPYVLYQTTTDTTQLETAEDSIVAVVDYASKYYKDNLKDVLGVYNVNTISLNYVKTVINACSNDMTSTTYEKIGPMLTSAVLTSLVADGDKIKPTIKIGVPYPVNGVDVTLQV